MVNREAKKAWQVLRTNGPDESVGITLIFAYLSSFWFILHWSFDLFILDSHAASFHERFEMSCRRHHKVGTSSSSISIPALLFRPASCGMARKKNEPEKDKQSLRVL